jgi:hypothetical protein
LGLGPNSEIIIESSGKNRSDTLVAVISMAAASLPWPGSVRAQQPMSSSVAIRGRNLFFCSSVPWIAEDRQTCATIRLSVRNSSIFQASTFPRRATMQLVFLHLPQLLLLEPLPPPPPLLLQFPLLLFAMIELMRILVLLLIVLLLPSLQLQPPLLLLGLYILPPPPVSLPPFA